MLPNTNIHTERPKTTIHKIGDEIINFEVRELGETLGHYHHHSKPQGRFWRARRNESTNVFVERL